jgi:hypothetical protein
MLVNIILGTGFMRRVLTPDETNLNWTESHNYERKEQYNYI